jgi:arginyl-tRNA synthetase
VKLSKRAGSYLTLRDLINEVGRDATRYFLVARSPNAQLTFDIDLAVSQSSDNPVYYIQYAHARVCSVRAAGACRGRHRAAGSGERERWHSRRTRGGGSCCKQLARFPEVVARAGTSAEPQQVANYLRDLAGEFHAYYNGHKVLVDDAAAARRPPGPVARRCAR